MLYNKCDDKFGFFSPQVNAERPIEEVFESVKGIFAPQNEKVMGSSGCGLRR